MIKKKTRFIALATLVAIVGCAPYQETKIRDPQLVAAPNAASVRLAEAADRASRSLEKLAAIEQSQNPNFTISTIPNAPQELRRTLSVDWVGPVEQIAADAAARASYSFKVFGNQPPAPVIVAISAQNRQVIDILRDIGLQLGSQANLKVDAQRRVVELYYPSALNDPAKG